jgi:hypothetical protein
LAATDFLFELQIYTAISKDWMVLVYGFRTIGTLIALVAYLQENFLLQPNQQSVCNADGCNGVSLTYGHQSGRSDWLLAINSLTRSGRQLGSKLDTESC